MKGRRARLAAAAPRQPPRGPRRPRSDNVAEAPGLSAKPLEDGTNAPFGVRVNSFTFPCARSTQRLHHKRIELASVSGNRPTA